VVSGGRRGRLPYAKFSQVVDCRSGSQAHKMHSYMKGVVVEMAVDELEGGQEGCGPVHAPESQFFLDGA